MILSGGESQRMGRPKHALRINGRTIIEHINNNLRQLFVETLLVGRDLPCKPQGVRFVEDTHNVKSPLAGIHSGLGAAQTDLCFVVACDMPYVMPDLVDLLLRRSTNVDVCVPVAAGFFEPLCAAYRRSALPSIELAIRDRHLKVSALYSKLRTNTISEEEVRSVDPLLVSFRNLNTPRDFIAHGFAEPTT